MRVSSWRSRLRALREELVRLEPQGDEARITAPEIEEAARSQRAFEEMAYEEHAGPTDAELLQVAIEEDIGALLEPESDEDAAEADLAEPLEADVASPALTMSAFTRTQWDCLKAMSSGPFTPGNRYGRACSAMVSLGVVRRIDRGLLRPQYELTEGGRRVLSDFDHSEPEPEPPKAPRKPREPKPKAAPSDWQVFNGKVLMGLLTVDNGRQPMQVARETFRTWPGVDLNKIRLEPISPASAGG
jgi:hypothetical protein